MRVDFFADVVWLTNQFGRDNEAETPSPDGHGLGEMSTQCVLEARRFWWSLTSISEWATLADASVATRGMSE